MVPLHVRGRFLAGALWLAPCLVAVFLAWSFLRAERESEPFLMRRPLRFLRECLSPSPPALPVIGPTDTRLPLVIPDTDPADLVVEAETAPGLAKTSGWETLRVGHYSGGAAIYTQKPGSVIAYPVALDPGRYTITLSVWTYSHGETNSAEVRLDDVAVSFSWEPRYVAGMEEISRTVDLPHGARQLRLRAVSVGQYALVLDRLRVAGMHPPPAAESWWHYACILGAVAGLLAGAAGWGALCWQRLGQRDDGDPFTRLVLQQVLGLGVVATAVTILGIIAWFRLPAVVGFLGMGLALGGRGLVQTLRAWAAGVRHDFRCRWLFVLVPLGVVLVALAGTALAPAVGVDSLNYHLPIAKWLIADGRFAYHPYQIVWGYPHNVSNLFAVAQVLYNDEFFRPAQMTHAVLGLLWLAVVYALGKELFGRRAGLAAVLVCLGIESVIYEMGSGLADLGFACFATASILAVALALSAEDDRLRARRLVLAALLAGVAAVCKVHGPTLAIALGITAGLWQATRRGWRAGLLWFFVIGVVSFAVASPMYLKNWLLYGNPVYPFTTLFPNRDLTVEFIQHNFSTGQGVKELDRYGVPAWQWPYAWVCKTFVDQNSPGPAYLVGLLAVPALGWPWLRRRWPLLVLVLLLAAAWLTIAALTRFAYPWLAVLAVLACAPLSKRPVPWAGVLGSGLLVVCAVPVILGQLPGVRLKWCHLFGHESHMSYLGALLPIYNGAEQAPPLLGMRQVNEMYHARPGMGAVLLDTHLVAYADFPHIPAPLYFWARSGPAEPFFRIVSWPAVVMNCAKRISDRALLAELTGRLGVRHVLLSRAGSAPPPAEAGQYPDEDLGGFLPEQERLDLVLERWVRDGLVARQSFPDSTLYSFDPQRLRAILK
jgi:hypothetical protein